MRQSTKFNILYLFVSLDSNRVNDIFSDSKEVCGQICEKEPVPWKFSDFKMQS